MSTGTSTFVIRLVHFLTMLGAVALIGYGVWISVSSRHNICQKSLMPLNIYVGSVIFLISVFAFLGAVKNNPILLWMYLIMLFLVLVGIIISIVLVFMVTNKGFGHTVEGLRYKEYKLQDYGSWFGKKFNNTRNWKRLQSCFQKLEPCSDMSKRYKTLKEYKLAILTPIEAGCCRPPSQCGYPAVNASYYDLSLHPVSSNEDCKLYNNSIVIKCYNCDSCKAGVAEYLKNVWQVYAIFNIFFFVLLSTIHSVGLCARRNAARVHSNP